MAAPDTTRIHLRGQPPNEGAVVIASRIVTQSLLTMIAVAGSGLLLAQTPQAVGTWSPAGAVGQTLTNGATVTLPDGRTLITGGARADGTPSDSVTIFDPVDNSTTSAGALMAPRAGHTATLLKDGRVLVVGGITGGLASSDIEIFDPTSGTSTLGGLLPKPRTGHVAARLADGTVLIAGGTTTGGIVMQTTALFDPATNSVSPLAATLQVARLNATATTLIDGRVLVAGGNDGTNDLASAEIYEPYSQTFAFAGTTLSVPRQRHSAVLLPHNGSVLIVGGTSIGAAQAGADLFLPAVFPDPFSYGQGEFASTGSMSTARSGAVAGPTSAEGYAFAAGGGSPNAEVYRFATIKTDKDDYAPGERAVITGSGWQPGERVRLLFQEDPAVHDDYSLTVTANSSGDIYWDQWAPEDHDLNVRFYLMATGSKSRAQTTFTDGLKVNVRRDSPTAASLTVAGESTTPVRFEIQNINNNPNQATPLTIAYTLTASGVSVAGDAQTGTATLAANGSSVFLNWNVTVPVGPASGTVTLAANVTSPSCSPGGSNSCSSSATYTFNVAAPADTTGPVVTPTITGTLGTNGWYTSDANLTWTVADPESTITSTTGCDPSSVTVDTPGDTFTCSATSAGGSSSASVTIKRDAHAPNPPVGTKTPSANGAGWNNTDVTVSFASAGDNGPSGIASCTSAVVLTADTSSTDVNGTCADNAGNVSAPSTVNVKIDKTGPVDVLGTPSRGPDHNSWYTAPVDVAFQGTDALSGIASCTTVTYSGPDGAGVQIFGSCTDNAGNTTMSNAFVLNYDATAPTISASRTPAANLNGWNNTNVVASYEASDALSGLESPATGSHTFTSEGAGQSHTFTVMDLAGNSASASIVGVNIDKTAPLIAASRLPAANSNGWNNTNVVAGYAASDALSGLDSPATGSYTFTSEGAGQSHTFTVMDLAGNSASASIVGVNIDKTAPIVSVTGVSDGSVYTLGAVPQAGCSTVDSLSGVDNVATLSVTGGVPPGVGTFVATCSGATDKAGNVASNTSVSYTVQYALQGTQCNGAPGHQILQPIDFTGSSAFAKKSNSTVPAKFRVCGVDGVSIGPQQVVKSFVLYGVLNGTAVDVDETDVVSTNGDSAFRWSPIDAQWIFNMSTKNLTAGMTYVYRVYLLDDSFIQFQFGIK